MLFLAVTLGFFVENTREHMVERQREKKYIRAMVQDLKEDTAAFRLSVEINQKGCDEIDSFFSLINGENRNASAREIYALARFIPFDDAFLVCQNKTFEQLKSSGGLRLIHHQSTLDSISNYYQISRYIESGPTPMQYQNRRDLFQHYDQLFDAGLFHEIFKLGPAGVASIPGERFTLLSNDPAIINAVCTRFHIMFSTKKVVISNAKRFIISATALIRLLQRDYHLKE